MSTRVNRHESSDYRWEMANRDAPAALRGYVHSYTGYTEWTAKPLRRREVPGTEITVILSPDTTLELPDVCDPARPPARASSFVAALHDRYALVDHPGSQHGVEVRLTPLGAHSLFGLPMHELTNRIVHLDELLGRSGDELVARLWDTDGWERRFEILDAELARRAGERPEPSGEMRWAWGRMRASGGRVSIGAIARELGWSHRRLIARFREQLGMPPKTLGRMLRFERVSSLLRAVDEPRLAEVALDCGYYDQAHLNRDFREFAGTTPGGYLASRLPDGGGVTAA